MKITRKARATKMNKKQQAINFRSHVMIAISRQRGSEALRGDIVSESASSE